MTDPSPASGAPPPATAPQAPPPSNRDPELPRWLIAVLRDLVPLLAVPTIIIWQLAEGGDIEPGWVGIIAVFLGIPILGRAGVGSRP